MWITESTKDSLQDIDYFNKKNSVTSIHTFDFSTLYTKFNLEDLKNVLVSRLDKAFKGGTCQYKIISNTEAKFDKETPKGHPTPKKNCITMIDYIIANAYFSFGNTSFQQVVGIPMGTDPPPYNANL